MVVALVGAAASLLLAVNVLAKADWDPTVFVAFGEESTAINEYGESRLGEIILRPHHGHDGKYFFVQANDPFLLAPEENIAILNNPRYRGQRMLYPVLAGGLGLFSPDVIVWAMIVVNVIAMGVGSWAVAGLALDMGGSPWWGLAFAFNPGLMSEQLIDGSGVVAAALAFLAILVLNRGKTWPAIGLLVLAVLAREALIVTAAGIALWSWLRKDRRIAAKMFGIPLTAIVLWGLYLRLQVGFGSGVTDVQAIGLPFVGLFESFEQISTDPVHVVARVGILLLLGMFLWRALPDRQLVSWAFVGFVPLTLFFVREVWTNYFDITRGVAPLITAVFLVYFLSDSGTPAEADMTGRVRSS